MGRFQYDLTFKTPDEKYIEINNLTMIELINKVKELLLIHYKLERKVTKHSLYNILSPKGRVPSQMMVQIIKLKKSKKWIKVPKKTIEIEKTIENAVKSQ